MLRDALTTDAPSSLGGERPKLLGYRADGAGYLMKFSPPPLTPQGVRCGIRAASSSAADTRGRTTLYVKRFDRLPHRGRVGAATLYWLAMDRYGDVALSAPEVVSRLHGEGLIDAASVEACSRVHAFSAAIGNNDAHLGNYGLLFDDAGKATLAPIYDVLPMALAPRNDELPDAYLTPRPPPSDASLTPWVDRLAQLMEADRRISDEFKDLWRRYVGLL